MASTRQYELLKNAYDDYLGQLNKNKVSAQNAIASSTEKAKSLLDTRLKSQGLNNSGMGLSQYTNLANNMNSNIASSNQAYNTEIANKNLEYQQKVADYQDAYNTQIKNEAQSLFNNMDNAQITDYINALKGNENIGADTIDYLTNYQNAVNNAKSTQALETAKSELANLDDYSSIQRYIESAKNSGLTPEQISSLEAYGELLSGGWKNNQSIDTSALLEKMELIDSKSNEYGNLLEAYNQISNAKTKEEYDEAINKYNVSDLISDTNNIRTIINEYSKVGEKNVGDKVSQEMLDYLVNNGLAQYDSKNGVYTFGVGEGRTVTVDKNGYITDNGTKTIQSNAVGVPESAKAEASGKSATNISKKTIALSDIVVGDKLTEDTDNYLSDYFVNYKNGIYTYNVNGTIVQVDSNNKIIKKELESTTTTKNLTKPAGMPESVWQQYLKSLK